MKWQDVKKYLIGSSVGIVVLFSALFLLTGFDYTYSGDIVCGETCESYINVTTTYWRICFDSYNGTKYEDETLFKKQTRSRTLHINLDKVDNIIHTEPEVEVDWLVPTYGNKWRPIKGGDCWERRKVNKIKLIGHKEANQNVKWSFDLGDKVNIDPVWEGEGDEKITYTRSSDKICNNGKCTLTLYSGIRNVYEDEQWKRVEEARSLKDKGFMVVYLENDLDFDLIVNDFNYSSISMYFDFLGDWEDYPEYCDKINDEIKCKFKLEEKYEEWNEELKEFEEIEIEYEQDFEWEDGQVREKVEFNYFNNPFGREFKFGGNSTTIKLQDADTENLADVAIRDGEDAEGFMIKWNITSVPSEKIITDSQLCLYSWDYDSTIDLDANASWANNESWIETITAAKLQAFEYLDSEIINVVGMGLNVWSCFDVTNQVGASYDFGNENTTLRIQDPDNSVVTITSRHDNIGLGFGDVPGLGIRYVLYEDKENSRGTGNLPYLNITYSEIITECSPTLNEDWIVSEAEVCDNAEVTTGTGGIVLISGGNLTLINNANVTTSGINKTDSGGYIVVYPGSQLRKI